MFIFLIQFDTFRYTLFHAGSVNKRFNVIRFVKSKLNTLKLLISGKVCDAVISTHQQPRVSVVYGGWEEFEQTAASAHAQRLVARHKERAHCPIRTIYENNARHMLRRRSHPIGGHYN